MYGQGHTTPPLLQLLNPIRHRAFFFDHLKTQRSAKMRPIICSILGLVLCITASASTTGPEIQIGPPIPPAAPPPAGVKCQPGGWCQTGCCDTTTNLCTAICAELIANMTVVEKLAARKALDNALSSAQLGSSCKMDSDCLPDTCCSVKGKCSAREPSQCGGAPTQATTDVPARLGSFCDVNSACRSACCSRVYGICMVGEDQQCLPQPSSHLKDEL